ncbi:MAG: SurA N-terminal domain-containing protein, partial [Coriobacteriales bacterium]|nr:SurA N-terminal domain-containing protein [Coriobacteriales bacterium]
MKKTVLIATVMALVIAAAGLVLGGCGKKSSGDVAATVRGEKLMESTVTDYIQDYRASNALEGDEDWANYLYINGYTPETLRENVIEYFADRMAVQQAAKSNGVQISDDEVREGIAQMRAQYGYTDDASWDLALQNMGFTADQFAEEMRYTMLEEALLDKAVPKVAASQEQLEEMAATYGAGYAGKRSSHILVADEASAQAILSRLQPQVE